MMHMQINKLNMNKQNNIVSSFSFFTVPLCEHNIVYTINSSSCGALGKGNFFCVSRNISDFGQKQLLTVCREGVSVC